MRAAARGWKRLIAVDLRTLAVFRIGLAALVLADLVLRSRDLQAHYTDWGVLPRSDVWGWLGPWIPRTSAYMLSGEAWLPAVLFLFTALAAVLLLVGWRSRVMSVIVWQLVMALQIRNPAIDYAGDNVLRLLLFWSIFLPLGARFSVDARRSGGGGMADLARPGQVASVWSLALLLQVCLVYWTTAVLKLNPVWLTERSALGLALSNEQHTTALGAMLKGYPALLELMTPAVLALELFGPLLVWSPWATARLRVVAVALFALFHLGGIGLTMKLGVFPWVSAFSWIVFLPGEVWDAMQRRRVGAVSVASPAASLGTVGGAHRLGNWLGVLLVTWVVGLNIEAAMRPAAGYGPLARHTPAILLGLHQDWYMFTPAPSTDDGWYLALGRLADGSTWDIWNDRAADPAKPSSVSATFGNARWVKYFSRLEENDLSGMRPPLGNYLCRRWNASHQGRRRVEALRLVFMHEKTLAPNVEASPEPKLVWQQHCPE